MKKLEEWLVTLTNIRLVFNTMNELEDFMDNHSIHTNGIKRLYPSAQKIRAAFRDLEGEAYEMTKGVINLSELMVDYKRTSTFYKRKLSRRTDPNSIALELLNYIYKPHCREDVSERKAEIFEEVIQDGIDIAILFLLIIKALPSYDSKDGDVMDIGQKFNDMLQVLEEFLMDDSIFSTIPSILLAKNENHKSRLMLITHTMNILGTYDAYSNNSNIYEVATDYKQTRVDPNIVGYWNECKGGMESTNFWQFEPTVDKGVFFATYWHKGADNSLTPAKYTISLNRGDDGKLIMYMLHPEAMKNRVNKKRYTDQDHAWYAAEMPQSEDFLELAFERVITSTSWLPAIHLTRVTGEKILSIYDNWMDTCKIVNPYEDADYEFRPSIYATTFEDIYIIDNEDESFYFKIPREACEGFEAVQLTDNVGIMLMGGKRYLAFDEIMVYIEINEENLNRYGISRVDSIK